MAKIVSLRLSSLISIVLKVAFSFLPIEDRLSEFKSGHWLFGFSGK